MNGAKKMFLKVKKIMNKLGLLLGTATMLMIGKMDAQVLIAGWDFSTTTNGGQSSNTPNLQAGSLRANFGSGTFYLDGTNGSSAWLASNDTAVAEIMSAGGTANNALPGWGTSIAGTSAIGAYSRAGQKSFSFALNMSGYENLSISYEAARLSSLSPTQYLWEYSADGTSWTAAQTLTGGASGSAATSWTLMSLSPITALNGDSTAFVRFTLLGGNGETAVTRFDNFQFNATAVPEPGTYALLVTGLAGLLVWRSLRKGRFAAM